MLASKITIIMPVYNTPAEYLEECLDSVFAQTFADFELICVDDASDREMTKVLIEAYENQHENMRVIRLEQRSGAAAARNAGFSCAESSNREIYEHLKEKARCSLIDLEEFCPM